MRGFTDVDSGIVDENVDTAQFAPNALDHGRNRRLVSDIGGDCDGLVAVFHQLSDSGGRFRFVAADNGDGGATVREPTGHAKADAAVAAGHDRDLAVEVEQSLFHGRRSFALALALPDQHEA
jgi:hypothetical protein